MLNFSAKNLRKAAFPFLSIAGARSLILIASPYSPTTVSIFAFGIMRTWVVATGSVNILVVISQLTREAQSRHRNGNSYGHNQTNNRHIIAYRSQHSFGAACRYHLKNRFLAQLNTTETRPR